MSVAVLYDIHGNLPALEAVMLEIQNHPVDQIVVGGDVIVGPMSRECLELLMALQVPIHYIKGNCEVSVLDQINSKPLPPLPESVIKDIQWTAEQMSKDHHDFMESWPLTNSLHLEGFGKILFCHATPRNENEIFTRETSEEKLIPIFKNLEADMVICGHTHMQFDRKVGTIRVLNAGSVGMPFGKTGAHWLLLGKEIEMKQTSYNLQNAADLILESAYPSRESFTNTNLLNPPTEESMLELFAKAELD
ncbi:MAG: metallophosphoesterase family protein [Cyclobacteriaceae bacterium]